MAQRWYLMLLLLMAAHLCGARRLVLITGATGTLGKVLSKSLLSSVLLPYDELFLGVRGAGSFDALAANLLGSEDGGSKQPKLRAFAYGDLDVDNFYETKSVAIGKLLREEGCCDATSLILFNGAGVCLPGSSAEAIATSIRVNALAPIALAEVFIERATSGLRTEEKTTKTMTTSLRTSHCCCTVINVSSGDGQLCYLDTALQREISSLESLTAWWQYCEQFAASSTEARHGQLAHGPTPAYSLSKALLNRGSQLLQREVLNNDSLHKVVCVCPGNFASPMSTEEELEDCVDVHEAAKWVLRAAEECSQVKGGAFYRYGEEIEW